LTGINENVEDNCEIVPVILFNCWWYRYKH